MSVAEPTMTPELARACIYSFVWQLSQRQDRRTLMDPQAAAVHKAQTQTAQAQHEQTLLGSVYDQAARWWTDRKREEYLQGAGRDALAELEGKRDLKGVTNHATGLPETSADLGSGREVMRGIDLAMSAAIPCWGLATAVSQTDETEDGEWMAIGYKALKVHCGDCKAIGTLPGPTCHDCGGAGERTSSLLVFFRKQKIHCQTCQGHGRLQGPTCERCEGNGTIQNWSEQEYETVRANARLIAREVIALSADGMFVPDPGLGQGDAEMDDLIWQDGSGDVLMFRITHKGYQEMQRFMETRPELQRVVPILEYAGTEVRSQAPQWAQAEYNHQRQ